ncbi:hypothetical protein Salat_2661600 [Sesamum alatum]|uniref:Uncharacterized protein n=1 Tax=Sesamum alatum TaxID=300844 RepID=A0AAE1XQ47_9LAMI|nr:hypothetical protein Salat_2661600 [Sesamum alatum]
MAVISSTSSQMSAEAIRKLVTQLTSGLRFPLPPLLIQLFNVLGIPPSQLLPNSYKKPEWGVPVSWGSSLNALPPLNLGEIKRRMLDVGLVAHEFKAKAILEEELLIVAGLHPAPDWIMMNRAVVHKFIPDDIPTIPLSSSTRSVSSNPSNVPSASAPRAITPRSYTPAFPQGTPIEVSTSPEEDPASKRLLSKSPLLLVEAPSLSFPAPILTPRLEPKAGVFNMSRTINRSEVELLSSRSVQGLHIDEEWARAGEVEAKLREEIEALRTQLVEKEGQVVTLTMENEVVKASTV